MRIAAGLAAHDDAAGGWASDADPFQLAQAVPVGAREGGDGGVLWGAGDRCRGRRGGGAHRAPPGVAAVVAGGGAWRVRRGRGAGVGGGVSFEPSLRTRSGGSSRSPVVHLRYSSRRRSAWSGVREGEGFIGGEVAGSFRAIRGWRGSTLPPGFFPAGGWVRGGLAVEGDRVGGWTGRLRAGPRDVHKAFPEPLVPELLEGIGGRRGLLGRDGASGWGPTSFR